MSHVTTTKAVVQLNPPDPLSYCHMTHFNVGGMSKNRHGVTGAIGSSDTFDVSSDRKFCLKNLSVKIENNTQDQWVPFFRSLRHVVWGSSVSPERYRMHCVGV